MINKIWNWIKNFFVSEKQDPHLTLYEEVKSHKVDKINRDKKEQIKDDWKDTQSEIDRAFRAAKSRNRMQDSKSE